MTTSILKTTSSHSCGITEEILEALERPNADEAGQSDQHTRQISKTTYQAPEDLRGLVYPSPYSLSPPNIGTNLTSKFVFEAEKAEHRRYIVKKPMRVSATLSNAININRYTYNNSNDDDKHQKEGPKGGGGTRAAIASARSFGASKMDVEAQTTQADLLAADVTNGKASNDDADEQRGVREEKNMQRPRSGSPQQPISNNAGYGLPPRSRSTSPAAGRSRATSAARSAATETPQSNAGSKVSNVPPFATPTAGAGRSSNNMNTSTASYPSTTADGHPRKRALDYCNELEKGIIREINRLRRRPRLYLQELITRRREMIGSTVWTRCSGAVRLVEGTAAIDDAINYLRTMLGVPLVAVTSQIEGVSAAAYAYRGSAAVSRTSTGIVGFGGNTHVHAVKNPRPFSGAGPMHRSANNSATISRVQSITAVVGGHTDANGEKEESNSARGRQSPHRVGGKANSPRLRASAARHGEEGMYQQEVEIGARKATGEYDAVDQMSLFEDEEVDVEGQLGTNHLDYELLRDSDDEDSPRATGGDAAEGTVSRTRSSGVRVAPMASNLAVESTPSQSETDEKSLGITPSFLKINKTDGADGHKQGQRLGLLSVSTGLCLAAQDHAYDIGPKGLTSHRGTTTESSVRERVERYGVWLEACYEIMSFGIVDPVDVVCQFLIDDGVPKRFHRQLLLGTKFGDIGIKVAPHAVFGVVCVIVLAGRFMTFGTRELPTPSYFAASSYALIAATRDAPAPAIRRLDESTTTCPKCLSVVARNNCVYGPRGDGYHKHCMLCEDCHSTLSCAFYLLEEVEAVPETECGEGTLTIGAAVGSNSTVAAKEKGKEQNNMIVDKATANHHRTRQRTLCVKCYCNYQSVKCHYCGAPCDFRPPLKKSTAHYTCKGKPCCWECFLNEATMFNASSVRQHTRVNPQENLPKQ